MKEESFVTNKNGSGNRTYLRAILLNLAVQFGFSLVLLILAFFAGTSDLTQINGYSTLNLVAMLLLQAAFLSAAIWTVKKEKTRFFLRAALPDGKKLLFAVVCAVICLICFSWLGEWFLVLLESIGYKFSELEMNGPLDIVLAVIVVVICAPICEETIFRNALLGEKYAVLGKIRAIIITGAAFALMHMSPQQTVYQFFLGCVCGYVALTTENIVCPMIVHAINNAAAIVLGFVSIPLLTPAEGRISVLTNNIALSLPITLVLAAVGLFAIIGLKKLLFPSPEAPVCAEKREENGKSAFYAGIAVCAAMWILNLFGSLL